MKNDGILFETDTVSLWKKVFAFDIEKGDKLRILTYKVEDEEREITEGMTLNIENVYHRCENWMVFDQAINDTVWGDIVLKEDGKTRILKSEHPGFTMEDIISVKIYSEFPPEAYKK